MRKLIYGIAAALMLSPSMSSAGEADAYPSSAVTIVVPFSAGGSVDLGARNLAEGLSELWGKPVVVENKPGGGTMIGTLDVAQAPADGLRLLYISSSFTAGPAIKSDLPYDPMKDFIPVAQTGDGLGIISVGPRVKATNIKELIAETRERNVFYTTSGNGSFGHLSSEAVNGILGTEMKPVHYKSGSESIVDVAGGRADLYIGSVPSVKPFLPNGEVRILATMSRERAPSLPDVPTLIELGYDNAYISSWWGVFAPAGTPEDVVAKINKGINTVLENPRYREFLSSNEAAFVAMTPSEFREFVQADLEKWREVAKKRGIAAE